MREFVVKRGKYEGTHKIYDNEKELFDNEGVSFIRKPWSHPNAVTGEWCYMDDGFIAQLLSHGKLISKKSGNEVETYRFAFGSRAVYFRKRDKKRVAKLFYTTNPSANKSAMVSQGYDRAIGGTYDTRKKLWVSLIAGGMEPLDATISVYKATVHNKGRLISITNKLIEDTKIRD